MPPKGTAHRQTSKRSNTRPTTALKDLTERRSLSPQELEALEKAIGEQFGWQDGPKEHQMRAILAQLQGRDCLVHAGTGSGKTGIAAGPHVHPSSKGKVTIVVSPLIALQEEQVSLHETY